MYTAVHEDSHAHGALVPPVPSEVALQKAEAVEVRKVQESLLEYAA